MKTENRSESWTKDILGEDFEQMTIWQADDYEGTIVCTLVRKKALNATSRAVLYVHGFNDYFFQKELAEKFNEHGYDFYAVDLRKYGRSWMPHQKLNNVRDINEYYTDLDKALDQVKNEGHISVLLGGHSTGGLTVSIYAGDHPGSHLFHALYLNSPFYDFNAPFLIRKFGIPLITAVGKYRPDSTMNSGISHLYGLSLYKGDKGEWDYLLTWKPIVVPPVNWGFVRAIHHAQNKVKKGLIIVVPVLVMHSDNSLYEKKWSDRMFTGDAILNVWHIRKNAEKIQGNVTIQTIDGGMHDLILSPVQVREKVYQDLFEWLKKI